MEVVSTVRAHYNELFGCRVTFTPHKRKNALSFFKQKHHDMIIILSILYEVVHRFFWPSQYRKDAAWSLGRSGRGRVDARLAVVRRAGDLPTCRVVRRSLRSASAVRRKGRSLLACGLAGRSAR